MKQRILVTGSNGQLGKALQQQSSSFLQFDFIFLSREELSIMDEVQVKAAIKKYRPQYLINCAAYTAVDKAEKEPEIAFLINADAVGILASACKSGDCSFIHISTDYVFDGGAITPYKEETATHPQSVYGASKAAGEELAFFNDPASIIIRTSWVYAAEGKNFVKTILRLLREKEQINVVDDQFGSPTYAPDLAEAILQIISSGKWTPGIYHYSNEGIISWFEFAEKIKAVVGGDCIIHPIPTTEYPTPAKRPAWSVLDKTKIREEYGIQLKNWEESLAICLRQIDSVLP